MLTPAQQKLAVKLKKLADAHTLWCADAARFPDIMGSMAGRIPNAVIEAAENLRRSQTSQLQARIAAHNARYVAFHPAKPTWEEVPVERKPERINREQQDEEEDDKPKRTQNRKQLAGLPQTHVIRILAAEGWNAKKIKKALEKNGLTPSDTTIRIQMSWAKTKPANPTKEQLKELKKLCLE